MYFKKIEIENVGPIEHLLIDFPTSDSGAHKPLIIVGENGAGKTILLSYLINTLLTAKQVPFDDAEVDHGRVYKYRSAQYIKSGSNYSYARVDFEGGHHLEEWQLDRRKSEFERANLFHPEKSTWYTIPPDENSSFNCSFTGNEHAAKELFDKRCCLYFPANRFEEPAWLNLENLKDRATYSDNKNINRYSNRSIISTSPLKSNRNWILDVIFDRQAFELRTIPAMGLLNSDGRNTSNLSYFGGFQGPSTLIYEAVTELVSKTLGAKGSIRFGAGERRNRLISIMKNEKMWVPNIFQLSTGEVLILNIFLSILRDYDLSGGSLNSLADVRGIVIIDEIDAHLHTRYQKDLLPDLIASFPGVQFIITTHSPLFLLGMDERLGPNGFKIINMPKGEAVLASDFSEFNAAYEVFKETNRHRQEISKALENNARPIVFVEGDYDIRYINRAAALLGKSNILDGIQLKDGAGFGNLDKIWRAYEIQLAELLPSRILLLYDCDTNKSASEKGRIIKRIVPMVEDSPITIGIENLIPSERISELEKSHPQFIDVTDKIITRVRGKEDVVPERKSINKDEKRNLCNWLCEHGTADDFRHFSRIFDMIDRELLNP